MLSESSVFAPKDNRFPAQLSAMKLLWEYVPG